MIDSFNAAVAAVSDFLFQDAFLFVLLGTGVAFTFWSGFCQYRALTHGGAVGYALVVGMRRALFSSEAGNGSSPIVHAAAKTDEPAREGVAFMFGGKGVTGYRYLLCLLVAVATLGLIETSEELDHFSSLGNGLMLWVNLPIMMGFGYKAMGAYKDYVKRLKSGAIPRNPQTPPFFKSVLTGKNAR